MDWIAIHGRQEYWRRMCDALGIDASRYRKSFTANSSNVAIEMAVAGAGCVVTQLSLGRSYLDRGLLAEPFDARPGSPWAYYLTENLLAKGPVVQTVRDWVLEHARANEAAEGRALPLSPGRLPPRSNCSDGGTV